jgi:hypothetical protein
LARSRNGLPINMDHADCDVTLNADSESWWDERVDAGSRAVAAVFAGPSAKPSATPAEPRNVSESGAECVPFWVPQPDAAPQLQPYLLD